MPNRIKLVRERLILAKMVLRVMQLVAAEYLKTANYGSVADDCVLLCAVFVGQAERKPMTAAKLADFAGMPRATVVRKLRLLEESGLVELDAENRATLPVSKLNSDCVVDMIDAAVRAVHSTAAQLSKMDAKGVAHSDMDS